MDAPRDVFKPLAALVFTEIDKGHVTFKGPFWPRHTPRQDRAVVDGQAHSSSGALRRRGRLLFRRHAPERTAHGPQSYDVPAHEVRHVWAAHFSNELPRGAKFPMELRLVELVGLRH